MNQEVPADRRENMRHYRLGLQLEPGRLRVVVSPEAEDLSLRQFTIPLDPTVAPIKALEDAIYATPMLLSDYSKIDVTVVTDNFTPVPKGLAEAGADICGMTDPAADETLMCDATADGIEIAWTFDRKLLNFIERTFRNCPVMCHISPLVRYFQNKALRGNTAKVFAHIHGDSPRQTDILVYGAGGRPLLLTTKSCASEADMVYFILAAMQTTGLSRTADEVQVCGEASVRDALLPLLRRYVRHAVPVIFPSEAFRKGREALNSPFPLILLNLCE